MVRPKADVESIHPCEFYEPADILEPDLLYTVPEIARRLQGLEPNAELDDETEGILVEWTVPWIMLNAPDLVVADPTNEDEPGMYGLRTSASDT